jgi:sterol desaturase/sphingolipid hydroxylase (fatty acid hydroxylase superfamily)
LDLLFSIAAGCALTGFIIIVCTIIEHISPIERHSLKARLPGLAMNLMLVPLTMAAAWPLSQLWQIFAVGKLVTIPLWTWLQPLGVAGYFLQCLVLALIGDFLIYWRHRTEHKVLWPIHAVHHSPTELHAANDIGHPMQIWFSIIFITIPMSLVQIDGPGTPLAVGFVFQLMTFYIHSPVDVHFGPLRKVLVDNRFHRIHHSLEPRHFDKNFGIYFSIWDRWFGTAYDPAPDEWPDVGLANVEPPRTIHDYLLLPFRMAREEQNRDSATPAQSGSANSWLTPIRSGSSSPKN